jgi:four helix bundle protein
MKPARRGGVTNPQEDPMAFDALEVAIELIARLQPVIRRIAARDPGLADQLRRAAQSNALALSEGGERTGRDQARFFRAALGSVTEARDALRIAVASDCIGDGDLVEVAPLVDRSRALDWRLVYPRR